jgi:hypothetical protein
MLVAIDESLRIQLLSHQKFHMILVVPSPRAVGF